MLSAVLLPQAFPRFRGREDAEQARSARDGDGDVGNQRFP